MRSLPQGEIAGRGFRTGGFRADSAQHGLPARTWPRSVWPERPRQGGSVINNDELAEKRRRVRAVLQEEGLDALVLRRPGNVAWYSGGGRSHVVTTDEVGVADLVITPGGEEVVTATPEMPRVRDEELGGLGATFTVLSWTEDRTAALPTGPRVGADVPLAGARDVSGRITAARRALTPAEVARYRSVGGDSAVALTEAALEIEPGDTEYQAAARVADALFAHALEPVVLLVAGAARVGAHRHPLPTSALVGDLVMLVACARRQGLIASLTRFVSFGQLPAARAETYARLLEVDVAFNRATVPGAAVGAVFQAGAAAYAASGFDADEWQRHHQGGPTGYATRDELATPGSAGEVAEHQAFAWNPSVPGLKSEDTVLAASAGPEVLTADPAWPVKAVSGLDRPLVLER